jgi:hypothetical protein
MKFDCEVWLLPGRGASTIAERQKRTEAAIRNKARTLSIKLAHDTWQANRE